MAVQSITMVIAASACLFNVQILSMGDECAESKSTANIVQACPRTESDLAAAALKKGCHNITNNCRSFEYHCVTNAWQNETVEVCSEIKNIVGKVCAEYSFGGRRIQRNEKAMCNTCPDVYRSNENYKYSECYSQVYQRQNIVKPKHISTSSGAYTENEGIITTSSPFRASIQAELTTESLLDPNTNHTNAENQTPVPSSNTAIVLTVGISIAVMIVIIFLIFLRHRFGNKSCSLKDIFSSLLKTNNESKSARQNDPNVDSDGDKRGDERFTEEHPLTVDGV